MAKKLFSDEEKKQIVAAIRTAENQTSGEIQVHIENHCRGDVLDRAAEVFEKLKMYQTAQRNGVLFYLAVLDHKFAILGDAGINRVVPKDFWESIKDHMTSRFKKGEFTLGLIDGIHSAGEQLAAHFPHQGDDDENELSDEISFGA
ncbi:TPM domain-containing protein [Algoriphagus hitonicola]|uniref:TLP18.3, Psb32 and MOLO-1 founding protein of phosphatase n=1 Tax=Algoriphagus hitonicola TaxID=435880 RepID=A0A1I2QDL1_9BACT|nr:TPM domain-containing protein [Algoriphagus hitonicola]SFG26605.1 TLP18.3, Psb32 and MOLO-1 founding protein of phosphatase [Algoriphagus hitonicola]